MNKSAPRRVLALRHAAHEGLGSMEAFLERNNISFTYWDFPDPSQTFDIHDFDAFVILGGPMGVYETKEYPFLEKEFLLIEKMLLLERPVLGICLGSQLLAHVLGARVYGGPVKEIGWYEITYDPACKDALIENSFKVGGGKSNKTVFQWHGDTFNLPKHCTRLFSSDNYPQQAFRYRKNVYAFQFHIEMTWPMIVGWLKEGQEEVASSLHVQSPPDILQNASFLLNPLNAAAEGFYQHFFAL